MRTDCRSTQSAALRCQRCIQLLHVHHSVRPKVPRSQDRETTVHQGHAAECRVETTEDREVKLHHRPAFLGATNDVTHDCCSHCPKPSSMEEEAAAGEESRIYVSGDVSFIKDDPSRQAISSSNPLSADDWTKMAYVSRTGILCQAIIDGCRVGAIFAGAGRQ